MNKKITKIMLVGLGFIALIVITFIVFSDNVFTQKMDSINENHQYYDKMDKDCLDLCDGLNWKVKQLGYSQNPVCYCSDANYKLKETFVLLRE